MMAQSENINELATALAKAQGQMQGAKKDSVNPFFKSHYADLASAWEACRTALSQNGLSLVQSPHVSDRDGTLGVTVTTLLMHSSGQWIRGEVGSLLEVTERLRAIQEIGSCITYLRRYSLMAFVGIAAEDDDGEAAMSRGKAGSVNQQTGEIIDPVEDIGDGLLRITGVQKRTISGGRTQYAVTFSDGRKLTTIASGLGAQCILLGQNKTPVEVFTEERGEYVNLKSVRPLDAKPVEPVKDIAPGDDSIPF